MSKGGASSPRMRDTTAVDQPRHSEAARDLSGRLLLDQLTELIPDSSHIAGRRRRNSADDYAHLSKLSSSKTAAKSSSRQIDSKHDYAPISKSSRSASNLSL